MSLGLDADHEAAVAALEAIDSDLARLRLDEAAAAQDRAGLAARVEALHVGLDRRDGPSALLAATDQIDGLLGSVAALVSVRAGYETATQPRSARQRRPWPSPESMPRLARSII